MGSIVWGPEITQVYDETYAAGFDPAVLDPMVDVLADLARVGPVLEFAVGTGRVALALAKRGVPVQGVELSPHMAERLRAKPGADAVPVTIGDIPIVPQLQHVPPGDTARVFTLELDHVGIETFDDLVGQIAWSHHWTHVQGRLVRHSAPYRYVWPSELELMGTIAGFRRRR